MHSIAKWGTSLVEASLFPNLLSSPQIHSPWSTSAPCGSPYASRGAAPSCQTWCTCLPVSASVGERSEYVARKEQYGWCRYFFHPSSSATRQLPRSHTPTLTLGKHLILLRKGHGVREALGLHARLGDGGNDRVDALQPLAVVGLACRAKAVRRLPEEAAKRGRGGAERAEHFGVLKGGW